MDQIDPYSVQPGRELDGLIHQHILGRSLAQPCPSYSTDSQEAERLKAFIETASGRKFVTGTTSIKGRKWFARYELDRGNPTEVLAETYPLAICRLVLLWRLKH